jgi:nucleoside-diphosphate-sugar epimerase
MHPTLEPVIGSLSDHELLRETAASVDFVVHATKEDLPAVLALIDGLASSHATEPPTPRLISISGTRSLIDLSGAVTGKAKKDALPWSDIADIRTILSLPKERPHAEADQSTIAHASTKRVGAMIVAPGQLWGSGKGIKHEGATSAIAYYTAVTKRGRAFVVGDGSVKWSWSWVGDLGYAVMFLMDKALNEPQSVGVNEQGYYLVRTDDVAMVDRAKAISQRLHLEEVESVTADVAREYHPFGPLMWGCEATFRSDRLNSLGWKPKKLDWRPLMEEEGGERA